MVLDIEVKVHAFDGVSSGTGLRLGTGLQVCTLVTCYGLAQPPYILEGYHDCYLPICEHYRAEGLGLRGKSVTVDAAEAFGPARHWHVRIILPNFFGSPH